MSDRPKKSLLTFLRYAALQLPGSVAAAGVLYYLVHAGHVTETMAYGLFALWVGVELAMFPVMRVAYESDRSETGIEAMVGALGSAQTDLHPEGAVRDGSAREGYVRVGAERWRAVSRGERIEAGSAVRVADVRALTLVVEPFAEESPPRDPVSGPRAG